MHFVIITFIILALIFLPQWWARYTFQRYAKTQESIPGTGGELARHLLKRFGMHEVKTEITPQGDHYDPQTRTVRLTETNFNGKSLTSIAVAAHEVGHAIQHHQGNRLLATRTQLVKVSIAAEQFASLAMMAIPVVALVTRAPSSGLLMLFLGVAGIAVSTLIHLVTLPVEWDASFGKALPILREGNYIRPQDEYAVRKILKAAALTYLASSLLSLLNFGRWLRIWRKSKI